MTATENRIRWMVRRDLEDVLRIESASFAAPWTEDEFLDTLRQRNQIGMVCEQGERVVGYFIFEIQKESMEIMTLVVDPKHRRTGIATAAIDKLKAKLACFTPARAILKMWVAEHNLAAQLFLKSCGILYDKTKRNYFSDPTEDGYLFVWRRM